MDAASLSRRARSASFSPRDRHFSYLDFFRLQEPGNLSRPIAKFPTRHIPAVVCNLGRAVATLSRRLWRDRARDVIITACSSVSNNNGLSSLPDSALLLQLYTFTLPHMKARADVNISSTRNSGKTPKLHCVTLSLVGDATCAPWLSFPLLSTTC